MTSEQRTKQSSFVKNTKRLASIALVAGMSLSSQGAFALTSEEAIILISSYAESGGAALVLQDYLDAGVTEIDAGNLNEVNAAILALEGADIVTLEDIQAEVDAVNEALTAAAIDKINAYDGDGSPAAPTLDDYADAGVTGLIADNLASINVVIGAATSGNKDTAAEIQELVNAANAAVTTLSEYTAATNSVPTTTTYSTAGITGVNSQNLVAINVLIAEASASESNTATEIQAIVTASNTAVANLSAYAGTGTAPSLSTYETAGITGVEVNNIAAVNTFVASAIATASDTATEIQAIVNSLNTAVESLSAYAGTGTAPTATIYNNAGITGVNAGNLAAINVLIANATTTASNSVTEIQAIVDAANAALTVLNLYDGSNTAPNLTTYTSAGITGVNAGNLTAMNTLLSTASVAATDTALEVQAIVNSAIGEVALLVAYTGVGTPPTVATYTTSGVLGVDASNVSAINTLVAAISSANKDTQVELQVIVDNQIAALAVLTNFTGAGTALTLAQYSAAGITGVTATNLTKINIAIAAASVDASNTAFEVQTIVNGLNAEAVSWTKRISNFQAKMYAKNIVGAGKVQFFHNNKEIAWVRAADALNPKLRAANGAFYLVRTVELLAGKNVLEIYIDGDRVRRTVYSR